MRRVGIPQRLYGIVVMGGLGLIVAAVVFLGVLFHVRQTLTTLHTEMSEHDQARVMQVAWQRQGQAWTNLLLRGHDSGDRATYRTSFRKESDEVQATGEALKHTEHDAQTRALLDQFLTAHHAMGQTYEAALERFVAGQGLDPKAADRMVRGQDRAATELIAQVVARLDVLADVKAEVADIRDEGIAMVVAIGGLTVLLIAGSAFVSRSITRPIAETVVGSTVASCSGRAANLSRPPVAISSGLASPGPSTGSGGGASGSTLHSCASRLAPVTPSTAA